jgi:hypothetical protein
MKFLQDVDKDIWSNFHVDHSDWIAIRLEQKIQIQMWTRIEFEFEFKGSSRSLI